MYQKMKILMYDNMGWVYVKTIQDSLVKLKIIEEDTNKIITNTGECQYIPIPINKNRKLIIKIESNKKKLLNLLKNENRYKNR